MKQYLKNLLLSGNQYYRLKYSPLFGLYEKLFKPELGAQHKKEKQLYERILKNCNLIFDIGAYDGHKTAAFIEISKKVICCEPDPLNYQILRTRFRKNKNVVILNKAVFNINGYSDLLRAYEGSAFNTLKENWKNILEKDDCRRWNEDLTFHDELALKVETVTLDTVIETYGIPDFIKLDVEGAELEVMEGLSHTIKAISFECTLPEFTAQAKQILAMLVAKDSRYKFNVIVNEELLFEKNMVYADILTWLDSTDLYTFDMLAALSPDS